MILPKQMTKQLEVDMDLKHVKSHKLYKEWYKQPFYVVWIPLNQSNLG